MFISLLLIVSSFVAQDVENGDVGRETFKAHCAVCHGADGKGGGTGPAIASRLRAHTNEQLANFIRNGRPERGMPPNRVSAPALADMLKFLPAIQRRGAPSPTPD